ncbi:hypothetical protein [Herbiconiux sp. VKM Ac-2851]|uniref:hypothetical protein n=1 Tax=Herbiconiux sp. VKM Ac-2851 TaxID=2739025 RepID=UPI001566A15D|nr:hypothetical protein [Herbiconiux sp. VKM Ac-2851]NQX34295.1 hypothetical protein [Herbiconiux sp. VKM Ac-2851]
MKRTFEIMAPYRWTAVLMSIVCGLLSAVGVLGLVFNLALWTIVFALWFGYMSFGFALRARELRLEAAGEKRR